MSVPNMQAILDLDRYPLDQPQSAGYAALAETCQHALKTDGMCNLHGLLKPAAAQAEARALEPRFQTEAFVHARKHNIYFRNDIKGLPQDHPALALRETRNLTLCADQLKGSSILSLYDWPPLRRFLATIMGKSALYVMEDPLARVNVMSYGAGDALNWHFDRSEFTTTLLLQAPEEGGEFEYRTDLRSAHEPNYDGVARLLNGRDLSTQSMTVSPGTLNVFRGVNTPHRVTPVKGPKSRIIAVFSYFDSPGKRFSTEEQIGFYGRTK